MDGIWQHPWFQQNLPEGVTEMNMHLLANPETFTSPGQQVCFLSYPSARQPVERVRLCGRDAPFPPPANRHTCGLPAVPLV